MVLRISSTTKKSITKKNLSTKKLYRFNNQYQSWDTIEDNLKLFEAYEAPSKPLLRTGFEFRGD